MKMAQLIRAGVVLLAALCSAPGVAQDKQAYAFNVLNQRTLALTAEYWNPILTYVSKKSGVPLELKLARNAHEANAIGEKGGYDFMYTNHFFVPERDGTFQVIARPAGPGLQAQIVVPTDSPIQALKELEGKDVGFVSPDGFSGYFVPYDALLRAKVNVNVAYTGNQEASFAQLKVGKIAAAAVNSLVMERYARREGFSYRVLWTSPVYPDLCIMAHKRLPPDRVAAVKAAFVGMDKDPEGRKVLETAAATIKITGTLGFVNSDDKDYDGYRTFFKNTLVKRK